MIKEINFIALVTAIGLGLGLGLTIAINPDISIATPDLVAPVATGVEVERVIIADLGIDVSSNQLEASLLSKNTTSTIFGKNKTEGFSNLSLSKLGQKIEIVGKNNGRYDFTIIEIRFVEAQDLQTFLSQQGAVVILYTPADFLNKNYYLVVAK